MTIDWQAPHPDFVPKEEFWVDDLETLKVLSDPLRLKIRELMTQPCTVKHVASELGIPATKLYYHINLLEKHGIIVWVDSRIVSGIIEKHYQNSAKTIRVAPHLFSATSPNHEEGIEVTLNGLFEDARADLLASIADGTVDTDENAPIYRGANAFSVRLRLTDEQAQAFFQQLDALRDAIIAQSRANQADKSLSLTPYKLFGVLFPTNRKN